MIHISNPENSLIKNKIVVFIFKNNKKIDNAPNNAEDRILFKELFLFRIILMVKRRRKS